MSGRTWAFAYNLFGRIADKRKLLKDEADEPRSEILERKA